MSTKDLYRIDKLANAKSKEALVSGGFVQEGDFINTAVVSEEAMHFVTVLEISPGETKGNHYHSKKYEHLVVLKGKLTATLRAIQSGETVEEVLTPGMKISIDIGCAHAFTAHDETVQFLEVSPSIYDPNDVYEMNIV